LIVNDITYHIDSKLVFYDEKASLACRIHSISN